MFLCFFVFIRKLYKRQAKIYYNTSFTIFTQKRIQDEKEQENEKRKWGGGGGKETYYNVNKHLHTPSLPTLAEAR